MGVFGLRSFLQSKYTAENRFKPERLPEGAVLIVDEAAFVSHILLHSPSIDYVRFCTSGGEYGAFARAVADEVLLLTQKYKLQLIFVADGSQPKVKEATLAKRRVNREAELTNLYNLLNTKTYTVGERPSLPLPPLCFLQLRHTVKALGCDVVQAPFEADSEIALICGDINRRASKELAFCYSLDSDFIVMENVPYIELGTLYLDVESHGVHTSHVWRRREVADILGLDENTFVEACLVMGNDFTTAVDWSSVTNLQVSSIPKDWAKTCSFVGSNLNAGEVIVSSDQVSHNLLEYARAFYQDTLLLPAYDFALPKDLVPNSAGHRVDRLSASQDEFIRLFMQDDEHRITGFESLPWQSILDLLEAALTNPDASDFKGKIAPHHVKAFDAMFATLLQATDDQATGQYVMPDWSEYLAANTLQLVIECMFEELSDFICDGPMSCDVSRLFDGVILARWMKVCSTRQTSSPARATQYATAPSRPSPGKSYPTVPRLESGSHPPSITELLKSDSFLTVYKVVPCHVQTNATTGLQEHSPLATQVIGSPCLRPIIEQWGPETAKINLETPFAQWVPIELDELISQKTMIETEDAIAVSGYVDHTDDHSNEDAQVKLTPGGIRETSEKPKKTFMFSKSTATPLPISASSVRPTPTLENPSERKLLHSPVRVATRDEERISKPNPSPRTPHDVVEPEKSASSNRGRRRSAGRERTERPNGVLDMNAGDNATAISASPSHVLSSDDQAVSTSATRPILPPPTGKPASPTKSHPASISNSGIKRGQEDGKSAPAGNGSTSAKSSAPGSSAKKAFRPRSLAPRQVAFDSGKSVQTPSKQDTGLTTAEATFNHDLHSHLPIDDHRDRLLKQIRSQQVTVVQGETGCGKSTRIPVFLYEDCTSRNLPCKMILCQPRRLATYSLLQRLRNILGDVVGMRMGHDVRDESPSTRIWVVTTGYLMQLLASQPDYLKTRGFTHLVIDEVHERSVECDVTVYLTKRSAIPYGVKLVLMSATANAGLYQDYFNAPPPIFVGARRFPVAIHYLDDLGKIPALAATPIPHNTIREMVDTFRKGGSSTNLARLFKFQATMVQLLARALAGHTRAILVFVSGMQAILDLYDNFEGADAERFQVVAIHSEIPFEEQTAIFTSSDSRTRLILATNAAESSITLPDVDVVICLGTQKELQYDAERHGSVLVESFISKSSAIQRAGRTGRVREGTVIRLYSQEHYELAMSEHDTVEILRQPLDDTILQLRNAFERDKEFTGVVPILRSLIQPPDMSNVKRSFAVLYQENMIDRPEDTGRLTMLGKFASKIRIGFRACSLIAKGIILGVGAEAVVLAAAISMPKTVFRLVSRVVHTDSQEMYSILRQVTQAALQFDCDIRSEPIMMLIMYKAFHHVPHGKRFDWMAKFGIASARFKMFVSSVKHILTQLGDSVDASALDADEDIIPEPDKLNRLRFLIFNGSNGALARFHSKAGSRMFFRAPSLLTVAAKDREKVTRRVLEEQLLPQSLRYRGKPLSFSLRLPPIIYTGMVLPKVKNASDMLELLGSRYEDYEDVMIVIDVPNPEGEGSHPRWIHVCCPTSLMESVKLAYPRDYSLEPYLSQEQKHSKKPVAPTVPRVLMTYSVGTKPQMKEARDSLRYKVCDSVLSVRIGSDGDCEVFSMNLPQTPPVIEMLVSDGKHQFKKLVQQQSSELVWTKVDPAEATQYEFSDGPLDYKLMLRYALTERTKEKDNLRIVLGRNPETGEIETTNIKLTIQTPSWKPVPVSRVHDVDDEREMRAVNGFLAGENGFGLPDGAMVIMNNNSILGCSLHAPPDGSGVDSDLYAVSSTISMYGKAVGFDCPTFLPPGRDWMDRAVLCSQWSARGSGLGLESDVVSIGGTFADLLESEVLSNIRPSNELIRMIDFVFDKYITAPGPLRELGPDVIA